MSSRGMLWARQQTAPTSTAKALLILLGELCEDSGTYHIRQDKLAEYLQLSRETVARNLALLEEANLIRREHQTVNGSLRRADKIQLLITRFTVPEPCDAESHGGASPCDAESHDHVTQNHIKRKTLTTKTKEADAPPEHHASEPAPEAVIAKKLYDWTKGALPYLGMQSLAKWAIFRWPDTEPMVIGKTMQELYRSNRGVTRQNLQRALDSIGPVAARIPVPAREPTAEDYAALEAHRLQTQKFYEGVS